MAALNFRRRQTRRWWYVGATLMAVVVFGVFYVAGAGAVLSASPSQFESNDGNLVLHGNTTASGLNGNADWNCFIGHDGFQSGTANSACSSSLKTANAVTETDLFNTTADDSWNNGTKMDQAQCPAVVTNKNPAKDDFTNVATYNETDSSTKHLFLYGATIRFASNGNASENVELNQVSSTTTPACSGPIARTAGDKLLAFDYLNGGTNLNLHALTWIDSSNPAAGQDPGNSGKCIIKTDVMPCWGATVITPDPTKYEGEANQAPIAAADNGMSGTDLVTGQFAEFGVDLTGVLGLSTTSCSTFAQAVWESRSSGSSFSSNPEDISIENNTITNCGRIKIIKRTSPRDLNQSFSYTSNIPNPTGTVTSSSSPYCLLDNTPSAFTLNDSGTGDTTGNTEDCQNVFNGTYAVTEGADPSGFTFTSVTCSGGETGTTTTSTTNRTATIVLAPSDTATCIYVNTQDTATLVTTASNTGTVTPGQAVHDSATVTGTNAAKPPSGSVSFSLCGPLSSASVCGSGGTAEGSGT